MSLTFGPYTLDHDTPTTRKAYAAISAGGADACTCSMCSNWVVMREQGLPAEVCDLLDRLGIDHRKESEVIWSSRRQGDRHRVSVRYHAIGVMLSPETSKRAVLDGVEIGIDWSDGSDLAYEQLRGYPLVRVEIGKYFTKADAGRVGAENGAVE